MKKYLNLGTIVQRCFPITIVLFLLCLGLAGCKQEQSHDPLTPEERQWLSKHDGKIRISGAPDWPPISFTKEGTGGEKQLKGMSFDFIELIEKKLSVKFLRVHAQTWPELLVMTQQGKIDVISSIQKTSERSRFLNFTTPHINLSNVIIVRKNVREFFNLKDLKGKRIAVGKGFSVTEYIEENYPDLELDKENHDDYSIIKKVAFGEVYAGISDLATISHLVEEKAITNLRIAGEVDYVMNDSIASRKDWPILNSILVKGLALVTQEERDDIWNKWVTVGGRGFPIYVLWFIGVVLIITIFTLLWNRTLKRKVDQKTKALILSAAKLKEAKEIAERANNAKSVFIANMSHEVRTPMHSILGYTELLADLVVEEKQKRYLSSIESSGKILLSLINDILDISKIESEKIDLDWQPVNLFSVIGQIEKIFSEKINAKELNFHVSLSSQLPPALMFDETRLKQILLNLVGNALKFTETGNIKLEVDCTPAVDDKSAVGVTISVEDTGIGISVEQQRHIFEPFVQQNSKTLNQHRGSGLGLTISRRLVELMGGEISVESEVGKGSVFIVHFNNACVASISPGNQREDAVDIDSIIFEKKTILVVDDEKTNITLLKDFLEKYDLNILEAQSGLQAIDLAQESRPDLILMDIKMPGMDGYETTAHIKKDESLRQIPIVALTASVMKMHEHKVTEVGCKGLLKKPVERRALINELTRFLPYTQKVPAISSTEGHTLSESVIIQQILSLETIDRQPELVDVLENKFKAIWEKLQRRMILSNVEDFAKEIVLLGKDFDINVLEQWGHKLHDKTRSIDIKGISQMTGEFPKIISAINTRLQQCQTFHEKKIKNDTGGKD